MDDGRVVAGGLRFPEGPVALPDGSLLVCELAAGRLTRIVAGGAAEVVAVTGGGPNGAAIGPDGRCYVCNSGGFEWFERDGLLMPLSPPASYCGGWVEAVDLRTGAVEVLYSEAGGEPLRGPNDLVFDAEGGFWFTDHGKFRKRSRDRGSVFYARPDGSGIKEHIAGLEGPNGIALSPDGSRLYVAETLTARLWAFDLDAPGRLGRQRTTFDGRRGDLILGLGGYRLFDSIAVDSQGNIFVATLPDGVNVVSPQGQLLRTLPTPDRFTTNLCFGGAEGRTIFVTLSATGQVLAIDAGVTGLQPCFTARAETAPMPA